MYGPNKLHCLLNKICLENVNAPWWKIQKDCICTTKFQIGDSNKMPVRVFGLVWTQNKRRFFKIQNWDTTHFYGLQLIVLPWFINCDIRIKDNKILSGQHLGLRPTTVWPWPVILLSRGIHCTKFCDFKQRDQTYMYWAESICSKTSSLTLDFDHGTLKINRDHLPPRGIHSLVTLKKRGQKILSGQHLFKDQQFDLQVDIWPCDLKINMEHLLSRRTHCTKWIYYVFFQFQSINKKKNNS